MGHTWLRVRREGKFVEVSALDSPSAKDEGGGESEPLWQVSLDVCDTGRGPSGLFEARVAEETGEAALAPSLCMQIVRSPQTGTGSGWSLRAWGSLFEVETRRPVEVSALQHMPIKEGSELAKQLSSPMPGKVISVGVEEGSRVVLGQELCVIEAMKMQNVLSAARDATVKELLIEPGVTVDADQPLILFE